MRIKTRLSLLIALFMAAGVMPVAGQTGFGMSPARLWSGGVAAAPRIPLVGDADGDGRMDVLAVYPPENGIIDFMRTSPLGKPCYPAQARKAFGSDTLAAACGPFAEPGRAAVLVLLPNGQVHVLHDMKPGSNTFSSDDIAATVPHELVSRPPSRAVAADFDGDGRTDVLLAGADGGAVLLRGAPAENGAPRFTPLPVAGRLPALRRLAAGILDGSGRADVVWLDAKGIVSRTGLEILSDGRVRLRRPVRVTSASPGDGLAVGRFRGEKMADILAGRRLLPGGDAAHAISLPNLPDAKEAKGDLGWLAGDFNGDGRDDLLRVRRSGDRFTGDDLLIHFVTASESAMNDADNDGLPDAWETGAVKPGGLDLAALGCSPRHKDLIVEAQRMENMPEAKVHSEMERVVRYFASLPVENPDGKKGIALHVLYREPIPMSDSNKPWWELGEKYHPASHRGVTHWMVVYNGGGGQSGEMTDRGGCGGSALYATFIHEFGHQLGLDHTGFWNAAWCPVYPSLMNYAFSYQLNGKGDAIGYSDGRLAGVTLNERHLDEYLPLPPDKVAYISGPPYHFRMKPAPDGKGTLVDWNWNGVFGEKNIAADINYGYSTTGGLRHTIGKTYTAPAPVVFGRGKNAPLAVFIGELPAGAPVPASSAAEPKPGLSPDVPGRLRVRVWQGRDPAKDGPKWSEETDVEAAGVLGDPSAAWCAGAAWVAYPTAAGVTVRRVTLDSAGKPQIGKPLAIPDSAGAQATLTSFAGKLALLLWRDGKTPVGMRLLTIKGEALIPDREMLLGFTGMAPVGAAEGAREKNGPSLWIGLSQDQDKERPTRWQVRRFVLERGGTMRETGMEWIGGEKGGERGPTRICLLWEPERALGPQGQLYFFGGGMFGKESPWSCHYVATRIADKTVNGGWLTRRYYDEWTQSRSAPGVCFFRGDIFFAARWFGNVHGTENDNLFVAFYGRGIESEPMGDFDDIGFLRDTGINHSILYVRE
jgi:hypothetical protein